MLSFHKLCIYYEQIDGDKYGLRSPNLTHEKLVWISQRLKKTRFNKINLQRNESLKSLTIFRDKTKCYSCLINQSHFFVAILDSNSAGQIYLQGTLQDASSSQYLR